MRCFGSAEVFIYEIRMAYSNARIIVGKVFSSQVRKNGHIVRVLDNRLGSMFWK